MKRRSLSLRARLTVLAVAAVAVAVVGVSLTSWLLLRTKLRHDFDAQLQSYARVAATAATPADALDLLQNNSGHRDQHHGGGLVIQFLDRAGQPTGPAAGDATAIPLTTRAQAAAMGVDSRGSELVRIGPDRYQVWSTPTSTGAVQVAMDAEQVEGTVTELGLWHVLVGLAGIAVAALLGRVVARTALRPVDTLTAAAEDVARTQDLSAGIEVRGTDELARLGAAFNAMLTALADSRDAQRRLVQDAGHELRTPLTSLRNNIELLVHAASTGRQLAPEDQTRLLADLSAQAVELTTLIEELVDLSTGERSPEAEELVDLSDVVGPAVERARARAPQVSYATDFTPARVHARVAALERAVLNLLDNAAKWSPPGSTVTARITASSDGARIDVDDEGPGIADADVPHVFQRFYRSDEARALPGSGLGLAIVEQIATQHGGTVWAGRAETGGARVSILLPIAPAPDPS
ncbi:HAMP domain-containing sensor histidine kinase [Actinokineospora inagensis]|uniref:HAMP domain-containing sensor histidine kinase n=1 Tax=Actinokineospora inagensis TaxID=103730 RepID=UPI0004230528|nr:HAMP domain-containing sensor histidine kinase [Actinokineospora inagensis]